MPDSVSVGEQLAAGSHQVERPVHDHRRGVHLVEEHPEDVRNFYRQILFDADGQLQPNHAGGGDTGACQVHPNAVARELLALQSSQYGLRLPGSNQQHIIADLRRRHPKLFILVNRNTS